MSGVVVKSIDEAAVRRAMDAYAARLLAAHPGIEEIVVFGSFAEGTWAPGSDLLRVDVLNTIGVSMMLMGIVCWVVLAIHRGPHTRLALVLEVCSCWRGGAGGWLRHAACCTDLRYPLRCAGTFFSWSREASHVS